MTALPSVPPHFAERASNQSQHRCRSFPDSPLRVAMVVVPMVLPGLPLQATIVIGNFAFLRQPNPLPEVRLMVDHMVAHGLGNSRQAFGGVEDEAAILNPLLFPLVTCSGLIQVHMVIQRVSAPGSRFQATLGCAPSIQGQEIAAAHPAHPAQPAAARRVCISHPGLSLLGHGGHDLVVTEREPKVVPRPKRVLIQGNHGGAKVYDE